MNETAALRGFGAIAHADRLRIVCMLVVAGADGMSAGAIAAALDGAQPSRVSFHLKELEQAGLTLARREGKSIIYSADFPRALGSCRVLDARLLPWALHLLRQGDQVVRAMHWTSHGT